MRIAAVILGILGGLLAGAIGFLGYIVTFGELAARVPSFPALMFLAMLIAIIGAILGIWLPRAGNWLLAAAAGFVVLQAYFLGEFGFSGSDAEGQPFARKIRDVVAVLGIPIFVLGLATLLSWRAGSRKAKPQTP